MKRAPSLFFVLLAAVSGCGKPPAADEDSAVKPIVQVTAAKVERADLNESLSVTGVLSPLANAEAKVAPIAAGRVLQVLVKTGDRVSKGDALAILDAGPLAGQVQQQAAAVKSSEGGLKQSEINLAAQRSAQRTAIAQAEQNVQAQQAAYEKMLAGSRPQEVAQAQAAVSAAAAALIAAQQNLSRSQTLFGEGLLARKDLEGAQAEARTATAQLESAQQALSLTKQGNRPQDIAAARIAVAQAKEQLRAAHDQELQTKARAEDVRIAQQTLAASQGALKSLSAQMGGLTIRAPLTGTVVGRTVNPGEYLDTSGSVATIVDLKRVRLLLNIPLGQIGSISLGQTVLFSTESAPDKDYRARISVINRAVDPATNSVSVEAVADSGGDLRDDGFVKASIILSARPHALCVPADAIVEKDGKKVAFVVGDDHIAHARTILTGVKDGGRVEVLSGLKEGEAVVLNGAFELEDGTQVQTGQ